MFDNSNRTTFVQRLQKVGMFDSDYVRLIRPKNSVELSQNELANIQPASSLKSIIPRNF